MSKLEQKRRRVARQLAKLERLAEIEKQLEEDIKRLDAEIEIRKNSEKG
jgi:hypothetical protein